MVLVSWKSPSFEEIEMSCKSGCYFCKFRGFWPRIFFIDIMSLSGDKGACDRVNINENSVLDIICQDSENFKGVDVASDLD